MLICSLNYLFPIITSRQLESRRGLQFFLACHRVALLWHNLQPGSESPHSSEVTVSGRIRWGGAIPGVKYFQAVVLIKAWDSPAPLSCQWGATVVEPITTAVPRTLCSF